MVDALDVVSLERMRFELRFPDGDIEQDALLTEQIKSAVAFVATDTGVNLLGLAADDPRLATFIAPVVVVARAFYDGSPRIPLSYDFLVKSLRRIV